MVDPTQVRFYLYEYYEPLHYFPFEGIEEKTDIVVINFIFIKDKKLSIVTTQNKNGDIFRLEGDPKKLTNMHKIFCEIAKR